MFFESPTQVKLWDADGGHYTAGVVYKNEIICGCCGGVFEIEVSKNSLKSFKIKDKAK